MRIALDATGGDHGWTPSVAGAAAALAAAPDLTVVLVGDRAVLEPAAANLPAGRFEIVHAPDAIGMDEKPVEALRKKPDNSISKCWQLLATKQVDGLVSAGNTGAVVGAGLFTRRFLKGIRKPGIAAVLPTYTGKVVLLDVGANVFPKPSHLLHYGVMGAAFAERMLGVKTPRVGLLNVGSEEAKGHDLARQAHALFRNSPLDDRFLGNVEGKDVHSGAVDVIVTDGFAGNVLLKYAEGLTEFLLKTVQQEVVFPLTAERPAAAAALKMMAMKYHSSASGGAPLLGVDGVCIKCHGAADERAIANALTVAAQNVRVKLNERIVEELATLPTIGDEE